VILTAEQVVTAISFLIPGFIALKILYFFGFRSRRSDLEWAVWSLLGSAAIAPLTAAIATAAGVTETPATFAASVEECVTPIVTGPEADRVLGVVNCATTALANQTDNIWLLVIGGLLGILLGVILVGIWRVLDARIPSLAAKGIATSWDRLFSDRSSAPWVEVMLADGGRMQGLLAKIASDIEATAPDLYLTQPAWLDDSGARTPLANVEGVWLPRSEVKWMVIVVPSA
jgi:Family of unknown function (DUF6338)